MTKFFGLFFAALALSACTGMKADDKSSVEPGNLVPAQRPILSIDRHTALNVEMQSVLDLANSGLPAVAKEESFGNDIWGWTDPETNREYAIMGFTNKTAFVDVTNPKKPIHLGDLPVFDQASIWQDIKVYKHYAYIVSEAMQQGLVIFDLHKLRQVKPAKAPVIFELDAHYDLIGNAHNIFINEASGYAYAVGVDYCEKGVQVVDIREPLKPKMSSCLDRRVFEPLRPKPKLSLAAVLDAEGDDAYTHDIQCVMYNGKDTRYTGREICFASNDNTVNIVDVTDKAKPVQIGSATYSGVGFIHQGWLTEDHAQFILDDEMDEMFNAKKGTPHGTRTYVVDLADLRAPKFIGVFESSQKAIDHNLYVHKGLVYQANYNAGLRILETSRVSEGILTEVGYFDGMPEKDSAEFEGSWSVYPFFNSGNVVVSYIDGRLFVVRPTL